jgi:hypothetical protein
MLMPILFFQQTLPVFACIDFIITLDSEPFSLFVLQPKRKSPVHSTLQQATINFQRTPVIDVPQAKGIPAQDFSITPSAPIDFSG